MKRKWIAFLLLASIVLTVIGCAKADELQGTWVLEDSLVHVQGELYKHEERTYAVTYTFDGYGNGSKAVFENGYTTITSFTYKLKEGGAFEGKRLLIDGTTRIPYTLSRKLELTISDENGVFHRLVFKRL